MTAHARAVQTAIDASIRRQLEMGSKGRIFGHYWEILNGKLVGVHEAVDLTKNTLPTEGINHCLDVWLGATAKPAGWYLGLYANAINPAAGWTAANVVATAGEIVSTEEGYESVTRPQFSPTAATGGHKDNVGAEALFEIVSESSSIIELEGVFLISDNARGGTAGKLASAARYPLTRSLQNGDNYRLGYQVAIVSA